MKELDILEIWKAINAWYDGNLTLGTIAAKLNVPPVSLHDFMFKNHLCTMDGRPEVWVTPERAAIFLVFRLVDRLQLHLASNSRARSKK